MSLGAARTSDLLLTTSEGGGTAAAVTVVGGSDAALLGARLLRVRRAGDRDTEGRTYGSLGEEGLNAAAVRLLDQAISDPRARDGIRTVNVAAGDDANIELFLEVRRPLRELVVVGAGHIAQPITHIGSLLGYNVTVMDDRPDFATRERFPEADRLVRVDFSDPFVDVDIHQRSHLLLVTRGHKYDYECLIRALRADPLPAYIGMIGSRRRVRATYVQLLEDGIERSLLDAIHAPVGLDVGAETPEEIAVAVAAELVLLNRGGTGVPLKDVERIADRFFDNSDGATGQ